MGGCQSTQGAAPQSHPLGTHKSSSSPEQAIVPAVAGENSDGYLVPTKEDSVVGAFLLDTSNHSVPHNNNNAAVPGLSTSASSSSSIVEDDHSSHGSSSHTNTNKNNTKLLLHSNSVVGLDKMNENRRESCLLTNVVHLEVPFGKPIEEVYDGVHTGPVLGSGISGIVRLVTHKATGVKYAVKCLDLGLVDSQEGLHQLREEIFIMCQLDHPNIVRLEEVYESHSEIYLVQELCVGGELFDRLDEQPDYHYTEAECARLIKNMLCAVRYLHSKGIIHRDLKLENFLFSSQSKDSELKMIDFGLSKHFRYGGEIHHEAVGTPYTVAPEVIRGSYDERCDLWAIGVIAFLLLSGDSPFGGCGGTEPLLQVRSNILRGQYEFEPSYIWSLVSAAAKDFIATLLVTDPHHRPTAQEAQQHEWLIHHWHLQSSSESPSLNPNVVEALVNFKEYSDMQKLLCEVLSFTLLPEQIVDLRKEFEKVDTDGSGEISLESLQQVLVTNAEAGSLGALTDQEVEDIFNAMRVKKSETRIHWHEFIAAGLSQCQVDDRNLRLAFDRLDHDHKGYVTLDDIMDLLGSDSLHSEQVMRKMWAESMQAVNCRSSARIAYEDFLLLMKGQMTNSNGNDTDATTPAIEPLSPPRGLHVVPEEEGSGNANGHANGLYLGSPRVADDNDDYGDVEDTPLSMDDDDDLIRSSLPSPTVSPKKNMHLDLPSLTAVPGRPGPYMRKRSRSAGDEEEQDQDTSMPLAVAGLPCAGRDARRAVNLPEQQQHQQQQEGQTNNSKTTTALQVNRQLYRAHRQMRLAVLEASKRFEEEQVRHAHILLQQQQQQQSSVPAGLVMRRGESKQVSSETVRLHLEQTKTEHIKLVEVATKRGGRRRGDRRMQKTVSDMSQMMGSLTQEEMGHLQVAAAAKEAEQVPLSTTTMTTTTTTTTPILEAKELEVRGATVPGNFRSVQDPFSARGKYGGVVPPPQPQKE